MPHRMEISKTVTTVRRFFSRLLRRSSRPQPQAEVATPQWLVVGLGNPGPRYATTRHNVGQIVLDRLADEHATDISTGRGGAGGQRPAGFPHLSGASGNAQAALCEIADHQVLLVKPATSMNLSGEAVGPLARRWQISPDHVIVVHDELDLPVGKVRLRLGGSENGHNGLRSVSEHLGTRDFLRVRVGVSRPPRGASIPDYVLSPLADDAPTSRGIETAAQAVRLLVSQGLARAQNTIHQK